jgi:hypothetical protein
MDLFSFLYVLLLEEYYTKIIYDSRVYTVYDLLSKHKLQVGTSLRPVQETSIRNSHHCKNLNAEQ